MELGSNSFSDAESCISRDKDGIYCYNCELWNDFVYELTADLYPNIDSNSEVLQSL
jgi:hypothetical protein